MHWPAGAIQVDICRVDAGAGEGINLVVRILVYGGDARVALVLRCGGGDIFWLRSTCLRRLTRLHTPTSSGTIASDYPASRQRQ